MNDLETRRYRNHTILEQAHELRIFINDCEKNVFFNEQVAYIKTLISEFANGVYNENIKNIANMAVIYKLLIMEYIVLFLADYCESNNLDYENLGTALLVEGEVINPCEGLGTSYNKLKLINRKTKCINVLHAMGRTLQKL